MKPNNNFWTANNNNKRSFLWFKAAGRNFFLVKNDPKSISEKVHNCILTLEPPEVAVYLKPPATLFLYG